MASIQITLFRDFVEDNRISMEVYADALSQALHAHFPERCEVSEYRPHAPSWLGNGIWPMRLSRFGMYPYRARRQQGQINHIVDHGYGHLLYTLDPKRTVVTVHDLIPLLRWQGKISGLPRGRKPWLNLLSFYALRRAKHLIAVSENTQRDLVQHCGCVPEQTSVVYSGIDPMFHVYNLEEKALACQELDLPKEDGIKRVLITGWGSYKNHTGALRAFSRVRELCQTPVYLVKTGKLTPEWAEAVRELGLEGSTRCLGVLPRDELPNLYNSVDCLLFPSFYEGFGWPPLEAMACGTPVVASNAGSLPEVIGSAGLMCDPKDEPGLAQATYAVLTNIQLRQDLIERGLKRVSQFTWERTAREVLEVYERIARR